MIFISVSKNIRNENKNPKLPEQKEKIKLIKYQNFWFTFGSIKLFETVIKSEANKEIIKAVVVLKMIVETSCNSLFKK